MQLSYRHASICANLSFNFLRRSSEIKEGLPLLCSSFGEFTAPLRHVFPIHNVTINSNNMFVNFHWTFTFCVEKSYDGTHLAFGGTLDQRCLFKHVSLKKKPVLPLPNEHSSQVKDQGRRQCCHNNIKNFPIGLT